MHAWSNAQQGDAGGFGKQYCVRGTSLLKPYTVLALGTAAFLYSGHDGGLCVRLKAQSSVRGVFEAPRRKGVAPLGACRVRIGNHGVPKHGQENSLRPARVAIKVSTQGAI